MRAVRRAEAAALTAAAAKTPSSSAATVNHRRNSTPASTRQQQRPAAAAGAPPPSYPPPPVPSGDNFRTTSDTSIESAKKLSEFDKAIEAAKSTLRGQQQNSQTLFDTNGGILPLPPPWEPFDTRDSCFCCGNSFTWHSTFRGDAQEYRERYNCRHCGRLVCGPCSSEKRPVPKWGMIFPRRVCDLCINEGDFSQL